MNIQYICQSPELYHYGVPGMKWGVRHKQDVLNAKTKYKQSKQDYNRLVKSSLNTAVSRDSLNNQYTKMVEAKANYKSLKVKKPKNSDKAYQKVYAKEIAKNGQVASSKDIMSGKSTALYNSIKTKKGKKAADAAYKKASKQIVRNLIGSVVATAGATAVGVYYVSKNL